MLIIAELNRNIIPLSILDKKIILVDRANHFVFFIISIFLIVLSGLRSSIGDTGYYMYYYNALINQKFNYIFEHKDWGFTLYIQVLRLFSENPQTLIFCSSLITLGLIFYTLYRYSHSLGISILLFLAGGFYISSMNGLRQFLVVAILFSAYRLIVNKKFIYYVLLIIVASTIHLSALVMIPVYFIVIQKPFTKIVYISGFLSIILFLTAPSFFTNLISDLLESTQYNSYSNNFENINGAHPIRILIAGLPLLLSFIYRERLKKFDEFNILVNFSFLNLIIYSISTVSWIFARLAMYFEIYSILLIPLILKYGIRKKEKMIIFYIFVLYCLILYYINVQQYFYSSFYLNINKELIGPLTKTFYNHGGF